MQRFPFHTTDARWQDAFRQLGEVSPPPTAWARIEAELPDAADLCFAAALHAAEVTPPAHLWESIELTLEQTTPLINFEQFFAQANEFTKEPTDSIWDAIDARLNEEESNIAAFEQFTAYEVALKSNLWDAIDARLNEEESNIAAFEQFTAYEVAPKNNLWDAIDARLNEDESNIAAFEQFTAYEVAPKNNLWDAIDARLNEDESNIAAFAALGTLEEIPVDTTWDNIAARLNETDAIEDEDDDFGAFRALANYEAAPPVFNWEQVVSPNTQSALETTPDSLDIAAAFTPLADFEATPHSSIWTQIEARLDKDDDEIGGFNRLRQLEEAPAAKIWQRISEELPFHPQLRYYLVGFSRVAAVLLLALGTATLYNNWAGVEEGIQTAFLPATQSEKQAGEKATNNGVIKPPGKQLATTTADKKPPNEESPSNVGENSVNEKNTIDNIGAKPQNQIANNGLSSVNTSKSAVSIKKAINTTIYNSKTTHSDETNFKDENNGFAITTPPSNLEKSPTRIENLPTLNSKIATLENPEILVSSIETKGLDAVVKRISEDKLVGIGLNPADLPNIDLGNPRSIIKDIQHDDPTEPFRRYSGWLITGNTQGTVPYTFQQAILNQLSPQGFETSYAAKIGYGGGFGLGYQFSDKFSLLLEYNRMVQGQGYNRLSLGNSENIDLTTVYNNFPLTANFLFIPSSSTRNTLSLIGGIQVGVLDQKSVSIKGDAVINQEYLAKTDLGVVLGSEYNFYFNNKRLILSPGMRVTYTQDAATLLQSTTTSQLGVGLRLGLTYRLSNPKN